MHSVSLTASQFPAQPGDGVRDTTVPSILIAAAQARGNETGLIEAFADGSTGRRWTFNEVLAQSERLALALASRFAPGERVAVWAPNVPEWVFLEFAAGMAGLTLVTVNPAFQPKELHYVLTQSRAVGLFFIREHRGNRLADIARTVTAELPQVRHLADMEDAEASAHAARASRSFPMCERRMRHRFNTRPARPDFPKAPR